MITFIDSKLMMRLFLFTLLLNLCQNLFAQNVDTPISKIIEEEVFISNAKKMVRSKKLEKKYSQNTSQIIGAIVKQYKEMGGGLTLTAFSERREIGHKSDLNHIDYLIVVKLEFDTISAALKYYNMMCKNIKYNATPDTMDLYMTFKSGFLIVREGKEVWFLLIHDCGNKLNKDTYKKLKTRRSQIVRVVCGLYLDED